MSKRCLDLTGGKSASDEWKDTIEKIEKDLRHRKEKVVEIKKEVK